MYEKISKYLPVNKKENSKKRTPSEVINLFKKITDEDKILLLIAHIESNNFSALKEHLHETFFELKKKFPKHFKNLYFTETENFHYCKKIDDIFFNFQFYNAINLENPNYEKYIITPKKKNAIKIRLEPQFKRDNREFLNDLDKMVKIIRERLEINE